MTCVSKETPLVISPLSQKPTQPAVSDPAHLSGIEHSHQRRGAGRAVLKPESSTEKRRPSAEVRRDIVRHTGLSCSPPTHAFSENQYCYIPGTQTQSVSQDKGRWVNPGGLTAVGPGAENSTGWMQVVEVGTWSHAKVCEGPLVPGHWSGDTVHLGGSVS